MERAEGNVGKFPLDRTNQRQGSCGNHSCGDLDEGQGGVTGGCLGEEPVLPSQGSWVILFFYPGGGYVAVCLKIKICGCHTIW